MLLNLFFIKSYFSPSEKKNKGSYPYSDNRPKNAMCNIMLS